MTRLLRTALLSATLIAPTALPVAMHAEDRVYKDMEHKDEHHWDANENRAYRSWSKENHRKAVAFNRMKEDDQRSYWAWRHEHMDNDHRR